MFSMQELTRRPSHPLDDLSHEIAACARAIGRRPAATGGIILLILGILGFIWVFPEIRRYIRIERM